MPFRVHKKKHKQTVTDFVKLNSVQKSKLAEVLYIHIIIILALYVVYCSVLSAQRSVFIYHTLIMGSSNGDVLYDAFG